MYNSSVQAIGKHKHIIFRHLSTAVDSTVCHNINKTVFTKHDKAYENYFLWNLGLIIVKSVEKNVFAKFQQNYAKNAKNTRNAKISKKCDNARENAIAFFYGLYELIEQKIVYIYMYEIVHVTESWVELD